METFGIDEREAWEIINKFRANTPPTNRTEQYILNKYIPSRMAKESMHWWDAEDMGILPYPYTDEPYGGKCYSLFGILAGIRDTSNPMIGDDPHPKGMPSDVSPQIGQMGDDWDDSHSWNYFTVGELLDSHYAKMNTEELKELGIDPFFFNNVIPNLLELGDKNDIRIVFFFDS